MSRRRSALVVLALVGGCASAPRVYDPRAAAGDFQRGVALGFVDARTDARGQLVDESLPRALRETRALGADHVSILVPIYTEGLHGTRVERGRLDDARGGDGTVEGVSAAPATSDAAAARVGDVELTSAIRAARAAGHEVMVFPIVRLRVRLPGEWRGKLSPPDRDAWWASYEDAIVAIARTSQQAGATRLVIGSELVSFEDAAFAPRWRELAARLRRVFAGRLLYSANWDRYDAVPFWDAVDEVGISAYFTLAERGADPTVGEIVRAWRPVTEALRGFSTRVGRSIVFTEVGFPSVHGAAFWPWNDHQSKTACAPGEGCEGALDLEAQRRLWAAFVRVFSSADAHFLDGAYAWLWAGAGGLRDRGYMLRGKPAEAVLKLWYAAGRPVPPPR